MMQAKLIKLTDKDIKDAAAAVPDGQRVEFRFAGTFPGLRLRVSGKTTRFPDGWTVGVFKYTRGPQRKTKTYSPPFRFDSAIREAIALDKEEEADKRARDAADSSDDEKDRPVSMTMTAAKLVRLWAIDRDDWENGFDPQRKRRDRKLTTPPRPAATVGGLKTEWLASLERKNRRPNYLKNTRGWLDNYVLSKWDADCALSSIKKRDVASLLNKIADTGAGTTSNRVYTLLSAMFNFGVKQSIIDANPMAGLGKPSVEVERARVLSDAELRCVVGAMNSMDDPVIGPYILTAATLALRRTECARLKWEFIDDDGLLTVPREETKTNSELKLPLPPFIRALLERCPRVAGSDFIFHGRYGGSIGGWTIVKRKVDAAVAAFCAAHDLALPKPWVLHDLRRTARSGMSRLGISPVVAGKLLNHADKGVDARVYDRHDFLVEKAEALERWSNHLRGLIDHPRGDVRAFAAKKGA